MKPTYYKIIMVLTLCLLTIGCYKKVIRQEEVKIKHNIIMVPFKAPPVAIIGYGAETVLLGGVVGAAMMDGATKVKREKIVDILNDIRGQWEPNIVLAEECSDLIKKNTNLQIENISIVESRLMPGVENVQTIDSKVFTAESQIYGFGSPWMQSASRMVRKSKTHIQYKLEYPQSNADWALEVFSAYIHISKMKKIEFNLYLKLVDTSSGEKVALDFAYDNFSISLGKDVSDFRLFEEEFRSAARQLCSKLLRRMGLIPKD